MRPIGRFGALASTIAVLVCAAPGLEAKAASHGRIVGRVLNQATHRPQAHVKVTLTTQRSDGTVQKKSVETGRNGRYEFDGLRTGKRFVYAIDGEFDRGLFAGSALQLPADTKTPPVVQSTLRVWPTTTDPSVIQLPRDDIFASQQGNSLAVLESVQIFNTSKRAYIGRGGGSNGGTAPTIAFSLPPTVATDQKGVPQVQLLDSDIDLPNLFSSEFGFAADAAIPPGKHKATFSYSVLGQGGSFDLSRNVLYPVVQFVVYATDPLDVRSNRLVDDGSVTVGAKTYARFSSADPINAGDPVQVLAVVRATTPVGLIAGLIVAGVLLLAFLAFGLLRRRRRVTAPPPLPEEAPQPLGPRDALIEAIAKLDLEYQSGAVDEDAWRSRRALLRQELDENATGPVAP